MADVREVELLGRLCSGTLTEEEARGQWGAVWTGDGEPEEPPAPAARQPAARSPERRRHSSQRPRKSR